MKQGNTLPNLMVIVLAVGLALYFIFSFWESQTDTFTTTIAYEHTVSESVDSKGVLIREEVLLPTTATGLLDVLRTEGEQVGVGQLVGRVYRDVGAMEVQSQLEALTAEAETLEYALGEEKDLVTVSRMDEEIVESIAKLRSSSALGNFNKLEQQISQVKGNVLRRDYIFGSPQIVKDLEDRYSQVVFEIGNSSQSASGSMSGIYSSVSGAYSILVDGLEYLTYDHAMNMGLNDLNDILAYDLRNSEYGVGKIITGDGWYFVTSISPQWAETLLEGSWVTVRFSGDFSQDIKMKVEQISGEEAGQQVVVLSSNRYLEQTTLLRIQSVELVYATFTGLRIPKESLRVEEYVNETTGETTRSYGVYVLSAGYAEFKPVTIVTEERDYYLVRGVEAGAATFRPGNEVIVNALGLYDGKLLVY